MSTQVIRIEGYKKGSLGAIGKECDRTKGVNFRNQEINRKLSHLNYSYKDASAGFVYEFAKIKAETNAQGKETKSSIAFEGMIITADLPFFKSLGYEKGEPITEDVKAFFDKSYEFAVAQIGYQGTDKNILSAKIHLDEKTPHLHLYYLPITEKWQNKVYAKDENGKVLRNAKGSPIQAKNSKGKTYYEQQENPAAPKLSKSEFWRIRGGQHSYRQLQDQFHEQVGKAYQLERGEIGSDRKHKKTAVYKHEQITKEIQSRLESLGEAEMEIKHIRALNPQKTALGAVKGVKIEDIEALKQENIKTKLLQQALVEEKKQVQQDKLKLVEEKNIFKNQKSAFEKNCLDTAGVLDNLNGFSIALAIALTPVFVAIKKENPNSYNKLAENEIIKNCFVFNNAFETAQYSQETTVPDEYIKLLNINYEDEKEILQRRLNFSKNMSFREDDFEMEMDR